MPVSHALCLFLLCSAVFIVNNHGFRRYLARQSESFSLSAAKQKQMSDTFYKRAIEGKVSARELDRLFMPDKNEYQRVSRLSTKGFAGIVFCLDTVLIDMADVYFQAYNDIANQLGYNGIDEKAMLDCIGLPFRDVLTTLRWKLEKEDIPAFEYHFFTAVDNIINTTEVLAQESAVALLDKVISDGNEVSIITHLPRDLAIKLLTKTGLKMYLEGRVESDRLITAPDMQTLRKNLDSGAYRTVVSEYDDYDVFFKPISGDRYRGMQLLTACSLMQKAPVMALSIERNRQNVLSARRAGLNCIALRGYSSSSAYLRSANRIMDDCSQVKVDDIHAIVRKTLEGAMGPAMQPSNQMIMQQKRNVKVIAPPVEDDKDRKKGGGGVDYLDPFAPTSTTDDDSDNDGEENDNNSNLDSEDDDADYIEEGEVEGEIEDEDIDYNSLFGPEVDGEKYFETAIPQPPPLQQPSPPPPQKKKIVPIREGEEPEEEEEEGESAFGEYDDDYLDDTS